MRKKQRGFVLVETLIVSVFIMSLLTLLYTNIFPIIAEYERRGYYDSVSSKYVAHWARKMILDKGQEEIFSLQNGYLDVTDCQYYKDVPFCENFKSVNYIQKIYLTSATLDEFKNYIKDETRFTRELKDYLNTLPKYKNEPNLYHVIVEMKDVRIEEASSYGTIEVRKNAG